MRNKPFKVNEQEYQLIQQIRNLKEKGFTDEDILQLDRNKEISKENMQKMRLETIKMQEMAIRQKEREIKYKKDQLYKKESLEKHDDFFDGKKPLFMLESDIEKIEYEIRGIKESIKTIQEESDKEEKSGNK